MCLYLLPMWIMEIKYWATEQIAFIHSASVQSQSHASRPPYKDRVAEPLGLRSFDTLYANKDIYFLRSRPFTSGCHMIFCVNEEMCSLDIIQFHHCTPEPWNNGFSVTVGFNAVFCVNREMSIMPFHVCTSGCPYPDSAAPSRKVA